MSITELDKKYIAPTYARFGVELIEGRGSRLWDTAGKSYIDMGSGIGVSSFGFNDEAWKEAVIAQLGKVQHTSNLYYTEPCARLAEMLCSATGMKKVFFSNSGAEANECAIKAARKYAAAVRGEGCSTIITLQNSFHGRTLTTLAATGQEHYHELFQPLTPGFVSCPANDMEAMEALCGENTAAVMIECIQGEGGVLPLEANYVRALAALCKERDILLIVDEVQTGNGRTGEVYAYMNFGITPDIVSTAKGLGGGLPLGATLLGEKVENVFAFGDHGSTFGGNPVCCAGAISVFSRLDRAFLDEVKAKGEYLRKEFEGAAGIQSVSGMGLMLGLLTDAPVGDVLAKCMERGVLCLSAKNKLRLLPALNISWEELREAAAVIKEVCAELA